MNEKAEQVHIDPGMLATRYQILANRTLIQEPGFEVPPEQIMIVWTALGLAGEAGEVADLIKKGIFHQHGLDRDAIKKELGDCLWYIAALCTQFDLSLSEVMEANIEKLRTRYPQGFSSEDSLKRADAQE